VVIREARQVMADGIPRLLLLGSQDQFGTAVPDGMTVAPISCQSEGALEVYIEPVFPVPHLVIVGNSPMTRTLAELARALDWRTDLVSTAEFTGDSVANHGADERSMIVIATQGHGDEEMIERAAALRPAYLGLVASRKRGEAVVGYLAERGVPQDQLDRVHSPAGLDLGKTSHEEMAVAILAELVQLRASGALPSVPAPRPESAHQPEGRPMRQLKLAEAVDPVCGMTVTPNASTLHMEHDGVTYYFCCSGCHRAFSDNPHRYVKAATR
jgi:xanthine dehydrogenase accessory factor